MSDADHNPAGETLRALLAESPSARQKLKELVDLGEATGRYSAAEAAARRAQLDAAGGEREISGF